MNFGVFLFVWMLFLRQLCFVTPNVLTPIFLGTAMVLESSIPDIRAGLIITEKKVRIPETTYKRLDVDVKGIIYFKMYIKTHHCILQ